MKPDSHGELSRSAAESREVKQRGAAASRRAPLFEVRGVVQGCDGFFIDFYDMFAFTVEAGGGSSFLLSIYIALHLRVYS